VKPALQKGPSFIADVRHVIEKHGSHLWWLGQSGFLIVRQGRAIVLDPYLSDSLSRKYASTDKPHVRITELVVEPELLAELGVINLITSSHNHTDHFDPETLLPLLSANSDTRLVIPAANHDLALERLGQNLADRLLELDDGKKAQVGDIEIHGIASAHNTVERDAAGRYRFLGYVIKWGDLTLYHSGDTLWHEGLVSSLKPFKVDVALLPINGNLPERRVAGNLDGREAAQLAHAIAAGCVIPCHYDLFEFNTASPDEFIGECRRLGQEYRILRNGEGLDLGTLI
jgi:L-ascorbate metabolism protein UlaG (beta-lactamase superfamily)